MKTQFFALAFIIVISATLWACADGIPGVDVLKRRGVTPNAQPITDDKDSKGTTGTPNDFDTDLDDGIDDLPVVEGPEGSNAPNAAGYRPPPRPAFGSTPTPTPTPTSSVN